MSRSALSGLSKTKLGLVFFLVAAVVVLVGVGSAEEPADAQTAPSGASKAVAWLNSQQEAAQGFRVSFDQAYDAAYVGKVSGRVEEAGALGGGTSADPACASGRINGVEIRLFSRTDVDYEQERGIPVCSDGSWKSAQDMRAGEKIARLVKSSTNRAINSTEWGGANSYRGLERSFFVPFDDPDYGYEGDGTGRSGYRLEQRSWIYDDAVAVFGFLANGEYDRADAILGQLAQLQAADGSLRFSYDVYRGEVFEQYVRAGSLAWVGSAALAYEEKTGDRTFRPLATRAADYLMGIQVTTANGYANGDPRYGSVLGGKGSYNPDYSFNPDPVKWASTEHNVDAYFFFRDLGYLSGDAKYADAANLVKKSLLENHWNTAEGRFNQGVSDQGPDTADALDIGSWGGIFLLAIGDQAKAASSAEYVKKFRVDGATIAKSTDPETYNQTYESAGPIGGYKPYLASNAYPNAPQTVWAEGTWGAILFHKRLGQDVSADLASMERMQAADPKGGFVQVTQGRKSLPYEFHVWPAVGGTGWAALVLGEPGLLWKPDRWIDNHTPPTPPEPNPDQADNFGPVPGDPSGVGDPVNATTGNVYDFAEDLNLVGRGLPLQFARFYNSQDTIRKPMGHGWTHSFNASLRENPDGSVTELDPRGARLVFKRNADGSYASPKGNHDVLTKAADGSYKLAKKNGVEWLFGPKGKLQKITEPNGNALDFRYTDDGLTSIVDTTGRETRLAYNGSGRLTSITDPAGREVRYGYSLEGNLTSVTDPAGNVTRYAYDAAHNLTKTTKPDGGTVSFSYDAQDRATSSEADGGAQRIALSYDPANNKTTVQDSKGNPSVFHYDARGRVTKIVDPYLKEIVHTYDADGNLASKTDQLGNATTYSYDGRGNPTKITQPKLASQTTPYSTTITYEPGSDRPTRIDDPKGGATSFAYDGKGNLISVTDAEGGKTTFEYDAQGQLVKTVDPKGNATSADPADGTTTYAYDAQGNLTEVTDAAANASAATPKKSTKFSYGADAGSLQSVLGLPSSVTDPLGRTTDLAYGRLGRLNKVTYPLTPPDTTRASTATTYDAAGNPTSVTDEKGNKTSYSYDSLGQLTKVVDPRLKETVYAYDTEGNLVSETNPLGQKTTYEYDKLRRLTRVARPDGTTNTDGTPGVVATSYGYDAAGRQTSVTDPKGRITQQAYDELSRLVKVTEPVATGTVSGSASYEYDALGQITKATNPNGHATSYLYNKMGRLLKETDPLGNATSYAYGPNGNVVSRTDANAKLTTYSYDGLNRLLATSYPDGTKVDNKWDEVGNLVSTTDKTGTTTYAYDERGRLLKETIPGNRVLEHAYDAAGNRTSLTDPEGKKTLFGYDAADRLVSVTDRENQRATFAYDDLDRLTGAAYPSGAGEAYAYDPAGRVASITAKSPTGTVLDRKTYAYDKAANPVKTTDEANVATTFAYDALDRLTKEVHPNDRTLAYTYDAAGNRKTMARTNAGATTTTTTNYTYDAAERMTAAGSTTFAYDKNGNQTSRTTGTTTTAYAYDFEDRLVKAGTKTYARDARGRVASTTEGTTKTDYVYDGQEILQQKVGTAAATHYTQGPTGTISRRAGTAAPTYYHHDAVGSVTALTSNTGAVTDTYSYLAFGGVRARTGTTAQPLQYVGNPYDSAAGMHDFEARFYDQGAGRFQSKDPVRGFAGMPQSLNPYAYGYDNPLAYPDPDGRCPICVVGLLAAGKLALDEVGTNAALSGGEYYLNHAADKGGMDWGDFAKTVGGDTLDETKQSILNPWNVPFRKAQKAQEVLRLADKANDARRAADKIGDVPKEVHGGQQGKHVPGHNNWNPNSNRSPLTHSNPQSLLDNHAGTGQPVSGTRGQPGYRERVDFGETIGEYGGQPTSKGIIHYRKDGMHIVPARP